MDKRCIERNVNDGLKLTPYHFTAVWVPLQQFWGRGAHPHRWLGSSTVLLLCNGKLCEAIGEHER